MRGRGGRGRRLERGEGPGEERRGTDPTFEPKHFVSGSNDRREERERRDATFQPKHFVFGSNDHRKGREGEGEEKARATSRVRL